MILSRRGTFVVASATLLPLAAACGSGSGDDAAATASLVATTSIWADVTSNVACGADVASMIPPGADPHSYEPSLRDRELVTGATVLVANGAGLEATTESLVDAAIADGINVVELANHVDVLPTTDDHDEASGDDHDEASGDDHDEASGDDHVEASGDDHGHGEGDPHFWQDPRRVSGVLDVIAGAVSAAGFETCVDEYRATLTELDAEIETTVAPIERRILVTSHDSLEYFADRYGFEVVGTVIPSTNTMAETSAGQLAELADTIETEGVRAIFTDAFESANDAEALADRLDIAVVPLVTGALTDDSPTYVDMMRSNAATIADALAP